VWNTGKVKGPLSGRDGRRKGAKGKKGYDDGTGGKKRSEGKVEDEGERTWRGRARSAICCRQSSAHSVNWLNSCCSTVELTRVL